MTGESITTKPQSSDSSLRVRDYVALSFQLITCVPLIVAVVAFILHDAGPEFQGIAFGIVAFSAAVLCAGITFLPGFRGSTRAAAWLVVLLQAIGWMIFLASGATNIINF